MIIELEKQISQTNEKASNNKIIKFFRWKNTDNSRLNAKLENEKNLHESTRRTTDEEVLLQAWKLYSQNMSDLKKRESYLYFLKKVVIGFGTIFLLLSLTIAVTCFLVYHVFDILNSIKRSQSNQF